MISARKMPEIYIIIARKIYFQIFLAGWNLQVCHVPVAEHGASNTSIKVAELVVTNCSPSACNSDLKTTSISHCTTSKSYACNDTS